MKEVSEGILYQEIYRDFSETADPMSAIFGIGLEDETHIRLRYCEGEASSDFYRLEEGKAELICSMHSIPPLSYNGFTEGYEIDGCPVDEEMYQAKWQELYEDQEYLLVIYEEGIPIKEEGLKRSLAGAVDQFTRVLSD